MSERDNAIDWSKTTFEGSRREQLRRWQALSLRQRLEALDRMSDLAARPAPEPGTRAATYPRDPGASAGADGVREQAPNCVGNDGRHEIVLTGCTPTPLASYLKALAVLRLVAEQAGDPDATGCWRNDTFILHTRLHQDDLLRFFLQCYVPTPLLAPWNSGSGFYYQEGKQKEKDPATGKKLKTGERDQATAATRAVDAVARSGSSRLAPYRDAIKIARSAVKRFGLHKAPDDAKPSFVSYLRSVAPHRALGWLDASVILADGGPKFPPLLGTGGNDGNLDFTTNFIQFVIAVLPLDGDKEPAAARKLLGAALFAAPTADLSNRAIGQFSPGDAGGPNATSGFKGDANVNPWDFILMLEGAVLLAASAARRLGSSNAAVLSAPFTVLSRLGTVGSASSSDDYKRKEDKRPPSRGEIWMPLWARDFGLDEIEALFSEGRAVLGARPAIDGLDFARAAARLGVDRGIDSFQRFGFLKRSGDAHLATPLSRVAVRRNAQADLVDELDHNGWLGVLHRFARDDKASGTFRAATARLDAALFALTRRFDRESVQRVLVTLGRIEALCAISAKVRKDVGPVPPLSPRWVRRTDDGSVEFRIALAFAGLRLPTDQDGRTGYLGIRPHLVKVSLDGRSWNPDSRLASWGPGSLERNLAAMLHRRLLEAQGAGARADTLDSRTGASLDDIEAFLAGRTDDRRIDELLRGLACVELADWAEHPRAGSSAGLPVAYLLAKPLFTSERTLRALGWLRSDRNLVLPGELPARLASGDSSAALRIAWQRYRALGLRLPGRHAPSSLGVAGTRLLAALTIPLTRPATERVLVELQRWSIEDTETDPEPHAEPTNTPARTH